MSTFTTYHDSAPYPIRHASRSYLSPTFLPQFHRHHMGHSFPPSRPNTAGPEDVRQGMQYNMLPSFSSHFEESLPQVGEHGLHGMCQLQHIPRPTHYPFRPLDLTENAPPLIMNMENQLQVPAPEILNRPVDVSAYSQVDYNEIATAGISYSAPSPLSNDSTGPLTPGSDGSSFTDKFFGGNNHQGNAVALSFLAKVKQEREDLPLHHQSPFHYNNTPHGLPITARRIWTIPGERMKDATTFDIFPDAQGRYAQFGNLTYQLPPALAVDPRTILPTSDSESDHSADEGYSEISEANGRRSSVASHQSDNSPASGASPAVTGPGGAVIQQKVPNRSKEDELLIKWRNDGMSYKDIKDRLGLKEAESTLRGRYRTLTKAKSERVRNPIWTERDERLLLRAVDHFANEDAAAHSRRGPHKIPWEMVSRWVKDHGGTYRFAAAACSKKFDQLSSNR